MDGARVTCYFASWSANRPGKGSFSVSDIPGDLCSHVIFAFAGVSNETWSIQPRKGGKTNYGEFTRLKEKYPSLKTSISVGGWGEGGYKFSQLVEAKNRRDLFVSSVTNFLELHGFDGLDLDWEYPASIRRDGRYGDKSGLSKLVQELRDAFGTKGWELTLAVPDDRGTVEPGFDVPALCRNADAIHVMTYNMRGNSGGVGDVHSPLFRRSFDIGQYKDKNVEESLQMWVDKGCALEKLVVGIPFSGKSFAMFPEKQSCILGVPINKTAKGGEPGPYTRQRGVLAYYEICEIMKNESGWVGGWDEGGHVPFGCYSNNWVGYENPRSVQDKVDFVKSKEYGGVMTWAVDFDDFHGICGRKYPLTSAMAKIRGN